MLKLIAILVLSGHLQVAVEQPTDYTQATFPNSEQGAQELIDFAERTVEDSPEGVRIVVGVATDDVNEEHILGALSDLGIKHGLASAADVQEATRELGLPEPSARAVVAADEKRFGFLYRRKKGSK